MRLPDNIIKKIIADSKFVDQEKLDKAEKDSQELRKPLTEILLFHGLISEEVLGQLIAEYFKVSFFPIKKKSISKELINLVPETTARIFRVMPIDLKGRKLKLGMEDPRNLEAIEFVKRKTGLEVEPCFISSEGLNTALGLYKGDIKEQFIKIVEETAKEKKLDLSDVKKAATEIPVIKALDMLLEFAVAEEASDIHIEIEERDTIVRFRVDGFLHDVLTLPKEIQAALVARIKILANLKIDEHRIPQDGRFKFEINDEFISLRVSILPSFYGENVVMRVLHESKRPLSLEEVGLVGRGLNLLKQNMKRSHGMILVTGPTGSGKTTTLYSVLNLLNSITIKICTLEEPVEYAIQRINQIQINPKVGMTFASGLRSLLRHDPDIIMVGEVRDQETANMAIHSALTGHLVLSTLHTNSALGAIPRLLDMEVEGFLVASTLNLVIAQRLVRRICPSCIEKTQISSEMISFLKKIADEDISKQDFYKGKGCIECGNSGYKGRVGIFEALELDAEIRQLITQKISAGELEKLAKKKGMETLFMDGLNKVGAGITTIEEVLRVVRE